jgi:predicted dehydrogenase
MIAAGVCDAVTITTPPQTRRALVLEAVEADLNEIADKPFSPNAAGVLELDAAAKAKGVVLSIYQNRRHDADIQSLVKVLKEGCLGNVWWIHSRMEFGDPATLLAGPDGGLLRDLGRHLVDQMVWLLSPVAVVDAQMDYVDLSKGKTHASFTITLRHERGHHSQYLQAN